MGRPSQTQEGGGGGGGGGGLVSSQIQEGGAGIFSHLNDIKGRKDLIVCTQAHVQLQFSSTEERRQNNTSRSSSLDGTLK